MAYEKEEPPLTMYERAILTISPSNKLSNPVDIAEALMYLLNGLDDERKDSIRYDLAKSIERLYHLDKLAMDSSAGSSSRGSGKMGIVKFLDTKFSDIRADEYGAYPTPAPDGYYRIGYHCINCNHDGWIAVKKGFIASDGLIETKCPVCECATLRQNVI